MKDPKVFKLGTAIQRGFEVCECLLVVIMISAINTVQLQQLNQQEAFTIDPQK